MSVQGGRKIYKAVCHARRSCCIKQSPQSQARHLSCCPQDLYLNKNESEAKLSCVTAAIPGDKLAQGLSLGPLGMLKIQRERC